MQYLEIVLIIAVEVLFLLLVRSIAARKGLGAGFWGCIALIFGPLALLMVLILPKRAAQKA